MTFISNQPPTFTVAASPSSGGQGTPVSLTATGISDPDDNVPSLLYLWSEPSPPSGQPSITLSGSTTATATFTMPPYNPGTPAQRRRTFQFRVTDSMGTSFAVNKTVEFNPNIAPTLNAIVYSDGSGNDQKILYSNSGGMTSGPDKSATLTRSPASDFDSDGDPLTFTWRIVSGPSSNVGSLSPTSGSSVTFGAPKPVTGAPNSGGVYTIGLVATDGVIQTAEQTINVLVMPSWANDVHPMFVNTGCTAGGCHGTTGGGNGLNMLPIATAYSGLVPNRLNKNNYANSMLYLRLTGTSLGSQMPKGFPALTQDLINMVRDWIEPENNVTSKTLSTGAENN